MLLLGPWLLLTVAGVEAGSRAWQPPIQHARSAIAASIAVRDLSGLNNAYSNGTNVSPGHHDHQKRFYGVATKPGDGYSYLWPNGNIVACFEQVQHEHQGQTKSTRDILYDPLMAARELWRQAGLDNKDGKFGFTILPDNDLRCAPNQRSTTLYIVYAGENVRSMSSTVGIDHPKKPPGPGVDIKDLGPVMTLVDLLDIGMENVVANYAHEMGVSQLSSRVLA
jgi:hypothetical protein